MFQHTIPLALVATALAFGQSSPNSITVTAARTNNPQPDQVVFQVSVTSPLTTSRDDVIAALQGSGIGLANFSGVSTQQTYNGTQFLTLLQWNFTLTAPLANMKSTVDMFTGLQMSLSKGNSALSVSFSVQGMQVSPQAQQAQPCSLPDLISDARAQALKIANAASLSLGSILGLVNAVSDTTVTCSVVVRFAVGTGI